jgi:hypothetical protein
MDHGRPHPKTPDRERTGATPMSEQWCDTAERFRNAWIDGRDVCRLMRRHGVKTRDLKARSGLTIRAIREARAAGIVGPYRVRDWVQAISGSDPGNYLDHPMIRKIYR